MSRVGKTWKDQKDRKMERGLKDPRPAEKGGMRNLLREAEEEMGYGDDFTEEELGDEDHIIGYTKGKAVWESDVD